MTKAEIKAHLKEFSKAKLLELATETLHELYVTEEIRFSEEENTFYWIMSGNHLV